MLDKAQTVFAEVLPNRGDGGTTVGRIINAVTYGTSPDEKHKGPEFAALANHPVTPIVIERVSVWSGGKIEDGHEWDVSTVTPPADAAPEKPAPGDGENGADAPDGSHDGHDHGEEEGSAAPEGE